MFSLATSTTFFSPPLNVPQAPEQHLHSGSSSWFYTWHCSFWPRKLGFLIRKINVLNVGNTFQVVLEVTRWFSRLMYNLFIKHDSWSLLSPQYFTRYRWAIEGWATFFLRKDFFWIVTLKSYCIDIPCMIAIFCFVLSYS